MGEAFVSLPWCYPHRQSIWILKQYQLLVYADPVIDSNEVLLEPLAAPGVGGVDRPPGVGTRRCEKAPPPSLVPRKKI